jgi:amino-acid N-acetyltransferase
MIASSQARRGLPTDTPAILALLASAGLPTSDISGITGLQTWVIETGDSICGVIALQAFGSEGLLRSLAVASDHRSHGIGRALVAQLERDARAAGVRKLVLLTQTAESFFRNLGYQSMDRHQVSAEIQQCAEFQTLCPASASCMAKILANVSSAERTHA